MWHGGHQAGEFITELAIHDTRLTRCSVQGRHRREPWPPRALSPRWAGTGGAERLVVLGRRWAAGAIRGTECIAHRGLAKDRGVAVIGGQTVQQPGPQRRTANLG
jgi:hypothetical protein